MTEPPHWLKESYQESIAQLDIGYVTRNIVYSNMCNTLLSTFKRNHSQDYLDYGGGYGLFTRLMRDKGFSFYNYDKYTEDIFTKSFNIPSLNHKSTYEAITCFEVFEHLENPMKEIKYLLRHTNEIIFSTELHHNFSPEEMTKWKYLVPETGQHVSFYHKSTFINIAEKLGLYFYSNGKDFHMLSRKKYIISPILYSYYSNQIKDKIFSRNFLNKKSLLQQDYNKIKLGIN